MAMGYPDHVAGVVHCKSAIGGGEEHCHYGDYLDCCGTKHDLFIIMVACSCLLLCDRMLHRCYMPHHSLPMGHQEELYASMADVSKPLALGVYAGGWQEPMQDAHSAEAIGIFGDVMPGAIIW